MSSLKGFPGASLSSAHLWKVASTQGSSGGEAYDTTSGPSLGQRKGRPRLALWAPRVAWAHVTS